MRKQCLTDQQLQDIRERLCWITEGRWFTYQDETSYVGVFDAENERESVIAECFEDGDADFIAHAPEDMQKLLDEVERLGKEIKEWARISDVKDSHLVRNGKDIIKLTDEVERLNEQHEGNMEALQGWYDDYQELKQENERLSSDYDALYKQAMESSSNYERWEKEIKFENARLRQALAKLSKPNSENWTEIRDWMKQQDYDDVQSVDWYNFIAHQALEGAE